ncbi:MAG: hypothetical protein HPY61_10335 [Methanotrichaceae archaeon]|nr:hypothetical protein [Methanotrichaceae archaeon]
MERLLLLLFALLAISILADSTKIAQLGGNDGLELLESMANISSNLTEANNTTINLSTSSNLTLLGGENASVWWENMSRSDENASTNLSSWGSVPRQPPGPPSASEVRDARMAKIIRDNHLA